MTWQPSFKLTVIFSSNCSASPYIRNFSENSTHLAFTKKLPELGSFTLIAQVRKMEAQKLQTGYLTP